MPYFTLKGDSKKQSNTYCFWKQERAINIAFIIESDKYTESNQEKKQRIFTKNKAKMIESNNFTRGN